MNIQKRTRYILAALLALGVVAFVVVAMWPQQGVTQASFERIQYGMSLAEVEAILGRPPENSAGYSNNWGERFKLRGINGVRTVPFLADGKMFLSWSKAIGGENENLEQKYQQDWDESSVAELLEDGTDFFIDNLNNDGGNDASVAARDEKSYFSGKSSLSVTPFQRFKANMPGWNYKIAENPAPGEFRYLRFAWKRTEGPGIMLQFFSGPATWKRYYAGTVSERTKAWGHMIRVAEEPPRKWEVVTRDLFTDLGPITINGIGLSAMEEPGEAYFDHMYLGRSVEDLDRVAKRITKAAVPVEKKQDAVEPSDAPRLWKLPVAIGAAVLVLIIAAVLAIVVFRRGTTAAKSRDDGSTAQEAMVSFPCVNCGKKLKAKTESAGKSVKCTHCGKSTVVPSVDDAP